MLAIEANQVESEYLMVEPRGMGQAVFIVI
jgi:hypothetical protein